MGRLDGKVVFISGGARGQGAAEARIFAQEGAKVVIGDVLDAEGTSVASEIAESGGDALFVHLDVTDEEDWRKAIGAAVSNFGKLDVLVNNAGIWRRGRVEDTTVEDWDTIMDVNAKGVFLGTKLAIPEMRKAGGGSIINISSTAGLVGGPRSSAYTASKGAVRLFTKATAIQYAKEGIRANSIHPGPIETAMIQQVWQGDEQNREEAIARTPLGRIGTPEDIAYGALFLASDESSFMTGSELVIDGGSTAQ
ncbi:MAG: glucose 1-dehydrogenase [Chloroflexi bacterium]|nr:glucose 1-dehydrogenase [Chloroflexota bacterium]MCI0779721.1 glucose 1-dehydrogenase [Chloroflexota bacterium]MCI0784737.1 glucose 1-dehydrogenase [Chloroflexota bacterium]MCI0797188.1 glucose 1-dehydrogenase [Chloroflexota bacterium]MCI0823125.1 glucose 1-dehydrogenase [Chloroflexota bacterium]